MIRSFIVVALVAATLAAPVFKMKQGDPLSLLQKTDAATFSESMKEYNARATSMPFVSFADTTKYHKYHSRKTAKYYGLDELKPRARRRMLAAMERDEILYGGETFNPPPGHDLYFDFETFQEYAKATTAAQRRAFKHAHTTHHHPHSNSSSLAQTGAWTFSRSQSISACLEINVCASGAAGANGIADTCGQFGLQFTAELQSVTKGGKTEQTLVISGALNAGISFKAFGAGLSIYLTGQIDWEFAATPKKPFQGVYDALFAALKQVTGIAGGTRTVPKAVLDRAAAAREELVEELKSNPVAAEKENAIPVAPQADELKGLVRIHYEVLKQVKDAITAAGATAAKVQTALHAALYKNIYLLPSESAKYTKNTKNKVTIDQMIDDADFPCAKVRKKLGVDNGLFCSLLKYGAVLPANERKVTKGWIWNNEGSNENSKNSVKVLYKDIWPATNTDLPLIKDLIVQWFEAYGRMTDADFNSPGTAVVETVNDPKADDGIKTFTRIQPNPKKEDTTVNDPCRFARELFQALAMPSADLEKTLQQYGGTQPPQVFRLTKITVTGSIGITFGGTKPGSKVGYCTNDSNQIQAKYSRAWSWSEDNGFDKASNDGGALWFVYSWGSFFQLQISLPLSTLKSWKGNAGNADNPFFIRTHFSFPNGFIAGDPPFNPTQGIIETVSTTVINGLHDAYNQFKVLRDDSKSGALAKAKAALEKVGEKITEVNNVCKTSGLVKSSDGKAAGVLAGAAKLAGAAAVSALTTLIGSAGMGSLTEVGIQGMVSTDGFQGSVDVAVTKFIKIPLGAVNFYAITGDAYSITTPAKKPWG
jgi:hypothetical protein